MNMKKNNRFLASYLQLRFKRSVKGASKNELEKFLDENGWILYETETMIKDFVKWRKKEIVPKQKVTTVS
jgi:hypothetical protein